MGVGDEDQIPGASLNKVAKSDRIAFPSFPTRWPGIARVPPSAWSVTDPQDRTGALAGPGPIGLRALRGWLAQTGSAVRPRRPLSSWVRRWRTSVSMLPRHEV